MELLKDENIKNDEVRCVRNMKILFWNTHGNQNINNYVASLSVDYDVDILILAEYEDNKTDLGNILRERKLIARSTIGCDRIEIWSSYVDVEQGFQDPYYSIQIIKNEYIMCCVHLPSDLHGDYSEERFGIIQQMMKEIQKAEETIQSRKTIIIGDMNEMPYDRGCLNANAMHGLPVFDKRDRETRSVSKTQYRKFYNPMWNFLGDFHYPPGTYYLSNSRMKTPMWYMLDQVIISKDLLPLFVKEKLKIVTNCTYANLANTNGRPNKKISDHFPIVCEIQD